MAEIGTLQRQYLRVHAGATTGLDLCASFEPVVHARLVPEEVAADRVRARVDKSRRAWTYTYLPR